MYMEFYYLDLIEVVEEFIIIMDNNNVDRFGIHVDLLEISSYNYDMK